MKDKLPQRKNIRLKYYDYSLEGYYFITICTKNREEILGTIVGADDTVRPQNNYPKIKLTLIGKIIYQCLNEINKIYKNVTIDEYIIMPNHIHIIICLGGRTGSSAPTKNNTRL